MQLGVIVVVYNLFSEVFLLQMEALKKFCKDEFEVEVIDNSSDFDLAEQIKYHADLMGIGYTKTFANSQNGSDSHTWAANFAYQKFKHDFKEMLFIDHDVIPVMDFSVSDILNGGHVMAGLGQGAKKKYMWAGMVMLSNERIDKSIVDFSTNQEFGLDTGGNLYKIIEKYGEENCIFFNESYHQNPYFKGVSYAHYAMINNSMFMHFVNGSAWNPVENNQERISSLINIAKEKTGL